MNKNIIIFAFLVVIMVSFNILCFRICLFKLTKATDSCNIYSNKALLNIQVPWVDGHARMVDPASRATMWRVGYNNPRSYNDHYGNCADVDVSHKASIFVDIFFLNIDP